MVNVNLRIARDEEACIGFKRGAIAREGAVLIFASFERGLFANEELGIIGEGECCVAFKGSMGIEDPVFGPTFVTPVLLDILRHVATENGGAILELE